MSRLALILLLPMLCLACGKAQSSAGGAAAGKPKSPPREVAVSTPTPHPWVRAVVLHGTLEARERTQLAARVPGPIGRLKADLGDTFQTGALLAEIQSSEALATLAQAEAELAHAKSQLARVEAIRSPEAISRREIDDAKTRALTAEVQQQAAAQRVRDLKVVAPFAGTVARRYVSLGAFVKVGDPLFDFVSSGAMRLSLEVPARYVGTIGVGTRLHVEPRDGETGTGHAIEAVISRVSPALDPQTRTLRVEAVVDVEDGALRPGTFVLSRISLGEVADAMQLPRGAVYSTLGQDRVTVIDSEQRAHVKDVDLVGEADGFAYVRGLTADARVVVSGGASVVEGTTVSLRGAAPAVATDKP